MGSPLPCEQLEAPESVVSVVLMAEDVVAMVSVREKVDDILSGDTTWQLAHIFGGGQLCIWQDDCGQTTLEEKQEGWHHSKGVCSCLVDGPQSLGRSLWPGLSLSIWMCSWSSAQALLLGVPLRCSSVRIGGSCVLGMIAGLIVHFWGCMLYE